ncbi:hypothetical protein B9Z48_13265 [Limnohabitans sp. WS1]|nr:hypothetical protein B9Z48_13265 [Limnohabitans sp. WS1]
MQVFRFDTLRICSPYFARAVPARADKNGHQKLNPACARTATTAPFTPCWLWASGQSQRTLGVQFA